MSFNKIDFRRRTIILLLFLTGLLNLNTNNPSVTTVQAASGTFIEDFTTTTYIEGTQTNVTGWGTGTIENSRKKPTIVSSISSSLIGNTINVFVQGNYSYVTNANDGLKAVNITNPIEPNIVGSYSTPGIAMAVYVDEDYAYIADFHGDVDGFNFQVVDVSNPSSPSYVGKCETFDAARDVVIEGNLAYIANGNDGLCILNISNPANPTIVSNCDTSGYAYKIKIIGNYAYIADGVEGFVIIDITNPLTPTIESTFKTGINSAIDVIIEKNQLYVIDQNNGVVVANITDATTPEYIGTWNKDGASDGCIRQDFLFVTDINDGLSVVNITEPTALSMINTFSLPGYAQAFDISKNYAYIACAEGGFQVVQIADPSPPMFATSCNTPSIASGITIVGDYAYVACGYEGLQIFDISDPYNPILFSSCDTPGFATEIDIAGNYAYIADGVDGGLQIVNITNPSSPTIIGSYNTDGQALDVCVSGNYVYVADGGASLCCINITDPTNPTYVSMFLNYAFGISISGDYAYTASSSHLMIFDISEPGIVSSIYDNYIYSLDVDVDERYAYVVEYNSLGVIDFGNTASPSSPDRVGEWYGDSFGSWPRISVFGDYAYVTGDEGTLYEFDISLPDSPFVTGSYEAVNPSDVFVSGSFVYLTTNDSLHVLEKRDYRANKFASSCFAQSNTVISTSSSTITKATLDVNDDTPTSTSITYYLSADGGTNWEITTPGIEHFFINTGTQLKWKAELNTDDVYATPKITNLSIDFSTNLVSPSLDLPVDNHITDDYTPSFTWFSINGESQYLFQIDTTISFDSPIVNSTIPSSSTSFTPSSLLALNTYYWRVAGIDSEGDLGEFSAYRTLYIIEDTNNPTINHPSDISYELGSTGHSVVWSPTDSNPYWYNITLNSILTSQNNPWTGGDILFNIDGLPLGIHTVVCSVYDVEGLVTSDTVEIEVTTTAPPVIDDVTDFAYEEGDTGNSITWHPSDSNPDYYSITRDGITIDEGPWLGGDITVNIDGLAYESYTFVCFVNDTEGQSASDTVVVTVTDSVSPLLNSPLDVIYEEGETGNIIVWIATDNNPATYTVYKDGIVYETDSWITGSSISISVDGLSSEQYNFTIVVFDQAGNKAIDTVIVAVTASVAEFNKNLFFGIIIISLVFVTFNIRHKKHKKD